MPDYLQRIKERIVPFGFSLGAIAVGSFLLLDDAEDFGEFATPQHPTFVHHWWIGLIVLVLGVVLLLFTIFWEGKEGEKNAS